VAEAELCRLGSKSHALIDVSCGLESKTATRIIITKAYCVRNSVIEMRSEVEIRVNEMLCHRPEDQI
jgi:hypothetical protein